MVRPLSRATSLPESGQSDRRCAPVVRHVVSDVEFQLTLFQLALFQLTLFQEALFQLTLFQDAEFQETLFQLALFQDAEFQEALFQETLFHEALASAALFHDAASNTEPPASGSLLTNWSRPAFGFGGSVTPAALFAVI